ncbi:MAG: LPXTG cell wall anchor domain-containing protein [Oscillochloris sp.]|nr:LPXTG cell wall anchor domain-containing protein [Oscillochloris sp.]
MPRYRFLTLIIFIVLTLLGSPQLASAQSSTKITGIVYLNDTAVLPSTALVIIQLADISQTGVPATVVTQRVFSTGGAQPPFSFTLPYDPELINANKRYSIQGNIYIAGQIVYTTTVPYPVITAGNGTSNLQIIMAKVNHQLPQSSAGSVPLLVAGALLVAGLGIMMIRRRLA